VKLVGPKPVDFVFGTFLSKNGSDCQTRLFNGVAHTFEPVDAVAIKRQGATTNVTDCKNGRVGSTPIMVNKDTPVATQSSHPAELTIRNAANCDNRGGTLEPAPVGKPNISQPSTVSFECSNRRTGDDLDTPCAMVALQKI